MEIHLFHYSYSSPLLRTISAGFTVLFSYTCAKSERLIVVSQAKMGKRSIPVGRN
jgi:hypothetical protein